MKRGKHYIDSKKLIDSTKLYESAEAIELAVQTAKSKFDETIELHVKLGIDPRHADQQVRGVVVLPNGTGKTVRVLAICKGAKADEAKAAGADFVGGEEMIQKIQQENWFDYDVIVTTPDMMGVVGRLGKVLGPKGLMPNPKSGTVTMDITRAIHDIKAGKVEYRVDKQAICHVPFGKASLALKTHRELQHSYGSTCQSKTGSGKRRIFPFHLHRNDYGTVHQGFVPYGLKTALFSE